MRDHDISQRRACQLVGVDPKTVRRTRPPDCPEIREEMEGIAGKRSSIEGAIDGVDGPACGITMRLPSRDISCGNALPGSE